MGQERDSDEHRVAFALRDALPTRRHGEMLVDMATDLLGPAARLEVAPDGNHRVLYRLDGTDPRWVVPWPLLTLDRNPRRTFSMEIPGLEPVPPPPPRPGKAPALRGLGPGFIQLQDGPRYVQIAYAPDGRWFETSRGGSPSTLEGVLPLLEAGAGPAAERLAEFMVALDLVRDRPLRVFLPVPDAWSAWAAWQSGIGLLRLAVSRGAIPADARWAVTDPVDGTALAWGATRDEALFAWSAEVERVRPGSKPPRAPELPSFEPPGELELPPPPDGKKRPLKIDVGVSFGGHDPALPPPPAPPPPPTGTIPAVLIPLPELPIAPPPLGRWMRFLGACGGTVAAAFREDPGGWTLLGAPALAALGAPDAEAALDEADRAREAYMRKNNLADHPATRETAWTLRPYTLVDESTGRACVPSIGLQNLLSGREIPVLNGDILALGAVRLLKTKG